MNRLSTIHCAHSDNGCYKDLIVHCVEIYRRDYFHDSALNCSLMYCPVFNLVTLEDSFSRSPVSFVLICNIFTNVRKGSWYSV